MKYFIAILLTFSSINVLAGTMGQTGSAIGGITIIPENRSNMTLEDAVKGRSIAILDLPSVPKSCNTNYNRVAIRSDHPMYDSVLAVALTAKSTGKQVHAAYFHTCSVYGNAFDLYYFAIK